MEALEEAQERYAQARARREKFLMEAQRNFQVRLRVPGMLWMYVYSGGLPSPTTRNHQTTGARTNIPLTENGGAARGGDGGAGVGGEGGGRFAGGAGGGG